MLPISNADGDCLVGEERLRYIRGLQSLVPLHEHTEAISLVDEGRIEVRTRLDAPVDEYGIPRPEIMVERLMDLMKTENYVWPGQFDEHHLATPKADFSVVRTAEEGNIGSAFRGLACLKIELPRQMHNFSHAIFELPGRPSLEIMRQAVLEVGQARQLLSIVNEHLPMHPHDQTEQMQRFCTSAIMAALEKMKEPEVGMMPSLETLATQPIDDVRVSVGAILRVRRFSRRHVIHPAIRKNGTSRSITAVA